MTHIPSIPTYQHEQGFTLLELIVAMFAAIIVVGGVLSVLEITLTQESRIANRTQANQIGRTAMSNIVDELHSACTGSTPIQAPTVAESLQAGPENLWFISAYGTPDSGKAELSEVIEHDINWAKTGTSNTGQTLGTLTDYQFEGKGTPGSWTFPALGTATASKTRVLAKNVIPPPKIGTTSPVFQYFQYETNSASANYLQLVPISGTLSAATAKDVAKVTINFTQAPEGENSVADTRLDRTVSLSDSVVLRLDPTTASSEGPCE